MEFPKMLHARGGLQTVVESRAEQDELDPARWFERPDLIPDFAPDVEAAEAEPIKRGPGRPRKA